MAAASSGLALAAARKTSAPSRSRSRPSLRVSDGLHCVEVHTLNYSGLWLEENIAPTDFVVTRKLAAQRHLDVVGAVIPADNISGIEAVRSAGLDLVGNYRWWTLTLGES